MAAQCDIYLSVVPNAWNCTSQSYRRGRRKIVRIEKLVGLAPGDVPASPRVSKERVAKRGIRACWIG